MGGLWRELVQGNEKLQQESARVHEDLARSQREVEKAQDEVALCRKETSEDVASLQDALHAKDEAPPALAPRRAPLPQGQPGVPRARRGGRDAARADGSHRGLLRDAPTGGVSGRARGRAAVVVAHHPQRQFEPQ